MNADHIGQLAQLTKGDRANSELVIESLLAYIQVLNADKRHLVDIVAKLVERDVLVDTRLRDLMTAMHSSLCTAQSVAQDSTPWASMVACLESAIYLSITPTYPDDPLTLATASVAVQPVAEQYASCSGVILQAAQAKLEERLTKVKKSLLNKPWLRTQTRDQKTPEKAPQTEQQASKVVVASTPSTGGYNGPENG